MNSMVESTPDSAYTCFFSPPTIRVCIWRVESVRIRVTVSGAVLVDNGGVAAGLLLHVEKGLAQISTILLKRAIRTDWVLGYVS